MLINDADSKLTVGGRYVLSIAKDTPLCGGLKSAEDIDLMFTYISNGEGTVFSCSEVTWRKTFFSSFTITDVEVTSANIDWGWINFQFSSTDYTGAQASKEISKTSYLNYFNMYDKIYCNLDKKAVCSKGIDLLHYNLKGKQYAIDMGQVNNLPDGTKLRYITIPAGTIFPSYAYVDSKGATKTAFRVTKDVTFGFNTHDYSISGDMSSRIVEFVDSDVDNFSVAAINALWPAFHLTVNDFNTPGATVQKTIGNTGGLNFYENITFNFYNTEKNVYEDDVPFKNVMTSTIAYLYYFQNPTDYIGFAIATGDGFPYGSSQSNYRSVYIPKGTIFPSHAYLSLAGNTVYRTTKDVTFILNDKDGATNTSFVAVENMQTEAMKIKAIATPVGQNDKDAPYFTNFSMDLDIPATGKENLAFKGLYGDGFERYVKFYDDKGNDVTPAHSAYNRHAFFADFSLCNYLFQMLPFDSRNVVKIVFEEGFYVPTVATLKGTETKVYMLEETETWYYNPGTKAWQDKQAFKVTFDSAGGSAVTSPVYVTDGDKVATQTVTKESTVSTVYSFAGWYNGETLWNFNDAVTGDLNLVAKWNESVRQYDVQFDDDDPIKVDYNSKIQQPADPVEKGHKFVGWYVGEKAWDFSKDVVTGDVQLVSKFEHIFNQQVEDEDYLAEPESCEVGAIYYYSCECGECGTQTFQVAAAGHKYVFVETIPATETDPGVFQHYECENCDKLFVKEDETYIEVTLDELKVAYLAYDAAMKIAAIGTVEYNDTSKAKIDAARAAYEKIPAEYKKDFNPDVYKLLTDAEAKYLELKAAAELAAAKADAIDVAEAYVDDLDESKYSETNLAVLDALLLQVKVDINAATEISALEGILTTFKAAVDALEPDLYNAKIAALAEVQGYYDAIDMSKYSPMNQGELLGYLEYAKDAINEAASLDAIASAVTDFKTAVNGVETDLYNAKAEALLEVNATYNNLDMSKYSEANKALLKAAYDKAIKDIADATTLSGVQSAADTFANAIKAIEPDLYNAKTTAIEAAQAYNDALDMSKYSDANQKVLADLLAKVKEDINAAKDLTSIASLLANYKEAVDKVETILPKKGGCGSSILAASALVTIISCCGVALLSLKKKND